MHPVISRNKISFWGQEKQPEIHGKKKYKQMFEKIKNSLYAAQ